VNSTLAAKSSSFCVANLRNSWLFRALGALNLNRFAHNPLRPEQIRGSLEHSDLLVNSTLAAKSSSFCVANLRNSWLFRALGALNLNRFAHNPLRPEQIRGFLDSYLFLLRADGLIQ
ncbi:MAG: hypothetical protein MUP90_05890, partial [Gammaproteobacteria bacterium]|nr:hypothetical protein [Gammaproteobacteria bacterium]